MTEIAWGKVRKDATTVLTGEFPVVFTEVVSKSSSNGKPMLSCKLKITSGTYVGRILYHNFTVSVESQPAMQMFFRHMEALGLGETFFDSIEGQGLAPVATALLGKEAVAVVESRPYQGVDRENITAWKTSADPFSAMPGLSGMTAAPLAAAEPPDDPF